MRIFLDDTACEDIHAESVADAIQAAANKARERGRAIVDVFVDGHAWSASQIDAPEASRPSGAHEVRLISADPAMLVCETFAQAADTLTEIDRLQQTAAELLQRDQASQAMQRLAEAIDLWTAVHQAVVMGSAMTGCDGPDGLGRHHETITGLTIRLKGVRDAIEQRDVVALADTLMYDLPETIHGWRSLLHELREHVRTNRTPHSAQHKA